MSKLLLSLALLSTLACSSFKIRVPHPAPVDSDGPRTVTSAREARQQCRVSAWPTGWVAVAYLQLGNQCPESDEDEFNGVQLKDIRRLAVGRLVDICADQVIPRGWAEAHVPPAVGCSGAHVDSGKPTSIRIRKVRATG